jgi:hypothetical protein
MNGEQSVMEFDGIPVGGLVFTRAFGGTAVVRRLDPMVCQITRKRVRLAARIETDHGVRYVVVGNDGVTPEGTRTWDQLRAY